MSTGRPAMTMTAEGLSPCSACGAPLPGAPDETGMVRCVCGHRAYAGYLAEAAYLSARLRWLEERIAAGDPAPDAETARRFEIWPAPTAQAAVGAGGAGGPSGAARPPAAPAGHGVQNLLLGLGAGLLIVAAVVFTAVVWSRLGAAGQVTVMTVATVGFAVAAARLVRRLPGTAEALGVVAFGLATVDVVAAPALGFLPDSWLDASHAYPTVAVFALSAVAVGLGHLLAVRAWVWLGWPTAAVGAALATAYLAQGVADDAQPWAAISVSVVALAAVGLLAGPLVSARLRVDERAMTAAGAVALVLAVPAWVNGVSDLDRPALVGTLVTTLLTAVAAALAYLRTRLPVAGAGAAALAGVSGGVALLLAEVDGQAYWLAALTAVAGVAVLGVLARAGHVRAGLLASGALWATWAVGSLVMSDPGGPGDQVLGQLSVLLVLVTATWFVVAGPVPEPVREPVMAWPAAVAGEVALLVAQPNLPDLAVLPESWTLPFAALLLLAGGLWRLSRPAGSLVWLGPGVAMALLPSAIACWAAPWVVEATDQAPTEALARMVAVLVVSVVVVALGAHLRLAGLLVPGSVALGVAGAAQVWGGLIAVPRWLALGLAGATLVTLGARIEWLRGEGRTLRRFAGSLH